MKRRTFLQSSILSGGLTTAFELRALPVSKNRFLLVFLRGGYDAANLLIPTGSPFYYEARPTLAIARPHPDNVRSALTLDSDWGLHPALRESIYPMLAAKEVAFIPFAGTNDTSRSHFETQDIVEAGLRAQESDKTTSGFLNRLVQRMGGEALSFTDALPTIFKGEHAVANLSLKGVSKPAFDASQSDVLAGMYRGHLLESAVREGLALRQQVAREFELEMETANRGAITTKGFELEARRIGRMMREHFQIGFVDIGGWDTHIYQGAAQGALANNLAELGRGLTAYAREMGSLWRQTVVVVVSEFGRTFRENGTFGTDHGHGSVFWVLGGSLSATAGGKVVGEQLKVERSTLFQDRDYPVLNEYRSVLGGLFNRLYSLSPQDLEHVFPGSNPHDLKLV